MRQTLTYLRCEQDHANSVPMQERHTRVGTPCSRCGQALLPEPVRERPMGRSRY